MAVSPRCLKQFIIARKYTKVWPATLRKIFGESCQVVMLVLKCLKALGAMLFVLFACIVFERKTFLLLTVVSPWDKAPIWISIMHIQILHAVLHTFLMELVERICSNIKTFHHWWWSFHSFPWLVCLIRQYYC